VNDHPDHIVLVGTMGTGKTTVGRPLAQRLGRPFVDSDAVLQAHTGRTAAEIVRRDGVDALHRLEVDALVEALADAHPSVIAAAGSVGEVANLRARLPRGTRVVWLRARPATLKRRALSGEHRPFVHDDPEAVARLDAQRREGYEALADAVVDTDEGTPDDLVDAVIPALGEHG
jgi:shikimate kinase